MTFNFNHANDSTLRFLILGILEEFVEVITIFIANDVKYSFVVTVNSLVLNSPGLLKLTKISGDPSLFLEFITFPNLSKLLYPGKSTKGGFSDNSELV